MKETKTNDFGKKIIENIINEIKGTLYSFNSGSRELSGFFVIHEKDDIEEFEDNIRTIFQKYDIKQKE